MRTRRHPAVTAGPRHGCRDHQTGFDRQDRSLFRRIRGCAVSRGVSRATIRGVEAARTLVEVTEGGIVRLDVAIADIAAAIEGEANSDPTGEVGGSTSVRAGIPKHAISEIEGVVVRSNQDGSEFLVGDVARVTIDELDRQRAYFVEDDPVMVWTYTLRNRGRRGFLCSRCRGPVVARGLSMIDGKLTRMI